MAAGKKVREVGWRDDERVVENAHLIFSEVEPSLGQKRAREDCFEALPCPLIESSAPPPQYDTRRTTPPPAGRSALGEVRPASERGHNALRRQHVPLR